MKNNDIKRLLTINPKALKGLHNVLGFDFEKPFACIALVGNFTINKVYKIVEAAGYDAHCRIALLMRIPKSNWYNRFHIVTVEYGGRVDIDHEKTGYNLDYFYRKADFENVRKNQRAETFIIVQKKDDIRIPTSKPFDMAARYESAPYYGQSYYKKYTLDKSGYIMDGRLENLKRRADQLRREREKNAYLQTDNTEKVERLRGLIEARKAEIVAELIAARTSEELSAVNKKLNYWHGLEGIMSDFEHFEKYTNNRSYSTIAQSDRAYDEILKKLEA